MKNSYIKALIRHIIYPNILGRCNFLTKKHENIFGIQKKFVTLHSQ